MISTSHWQMKADRIHVIRYTYRVLRTVFADAVKLGFISGNPAHYADVPVVEEVQAKI